MLLTKSKDKLISLIKGHKQNSNLSRLSSRIILLLCGILLSLTIFSFWLWPKSIIRKVDIPSVISEDEIPIGQSRYINEQEIFWWNRFKE